MAEQFGIQVKIEPQVDEGKKRIDTALAALEAHGKQTGDTIAAAIKEGFRDAATEAVRAIAAERSAMQQAEAAAQAAARAAREAAKAEREFLGAANEALGALREQGKAADDLAGKTERGAKSFAEQVREWIRGKGAAFEVIDAVGKLGLAMGTVNQAIAVGKMAWGALGGALDIVDTKLRTTTSSVEELQALLDSGALRDLPGIQQLFQNAADRSGGWLEGKIWQEESGGWNGNGLDFVERMFDAAIAQLEQNTKDYEDAAAKASDAITAAQNRVFSRNAAFDAARQEGSLTLARENERKRLSKPGAAPFWDPKWGDRPDDPDFRAPRRRGRTAPEDPHATSAVLDFVRAMESAAEAIANARAEEDAMLAAAESFGDGVVTTYYDITGAIESFTDASEESSEAHGKAAEKSISDAKKLADALEGPLAGAVDGLIDGLVRWEMSWKEWGSSVAQSIAKVLIQLLALQAIQKAFGVGGGGSTVGQLLWGIFGGSPVAGGGGGGGGGGSSERRVTRHTYGDPFGGGGGTSGAIWRAPVMAPQSPGGGAGGGGGSTKVVVVADMRAAALEAMKSPEGERVTIANVDKHRGKLGGR